MRVYWLFKSKSSGLYTRQSLMRREPAVKAEGEDEFLDSSGTFASLLALKSVLLPHLTAHSTADQDNVIADLRRQNAQSARVYSVRHCPPACPDASKATCSLCSACARSLTAFLCFTFCFNISCFLHSPRPFAVTSSCLNIRICLAVPWPCFCSAALLAGKNLVRLKRNYLTRINSAYMAYSAQFIMRLPQHLAQRKLQGDCM